MKEHLKILLAAGFSNAEITAFSEQSRVDYVANGIAQGIACNCKPWIHYEAEFMDRDPFEAMAGMSADERRELREYASASFDEFIGEIDDRPVSQEEATETANRILASCAIRPSTKERRL